MSNIIHLQNHYFYWLVLFIFSNYPFNLFSTTPPKKKVAITTTSSPNDDPNKIHTFCSKWGATDSIWIMFDDICPNTTLVSASIQTGMAASSYVQITNSPPLPFTYTGIPNKDSLLIVFDIQPFSNIPNNFNPYQFAIINLVIAPPPNASIVCSRTSIPIRIYISEEGCTHIDSTFKTGQCYTCKTSTSNNTLTSIKYNQFIPNLTDNNLSITHLGQGFTSHDTVVWYFGDGDSCTIINQQIIGSLSYGNYSFVNNQLLHLYSNTGTYQVLSKVKCYRQQNCIYKTYSTVTVQTVLPIVQIFPTYQILHKNVMLRWTTNLTLDNLFYQVYHSIDKVNWEKINTSSASFYEDKNVAYGTNYYQIVAIDAMQNEVSKSAIQMVEIPIQLAIYPNPVTHTLFILMDKDLYQEGDITINNVQGQTVLQLTTIPQQITVAQLPQGIYFLRINLNGVVSTTKFAKIM